MNRRKPSEEPEVSPGIYTQAKIMATALFGDSLSGLRAAVEGIQRELASTGQSPLPKNPHSAIRNPHSKIESPENA